MKRQEFLPIEEIIHASIVRNGFTKKTLQLIDNFINEILYGRTNLSQFTLQEHAGLCTADSALIGAYIIACYARTSAESSGNVTAGQGCGHNAVANWQIDALQESLVQQWAEAKKL